MSEHAGWVPLCDAAGVERSLDLAFSIARRMSDPSVVERAVASAQAATAEQAYIYWQPYSIAQGDAGVALMFGVFDACFPDQGWDQAAHRWIERASRGAEAAVGLPAGLFEGLSGLAFAAAYLSRGGRRYRKLVDHLHDCVIEKAKVAIVELDRWVRNGGAPFTAWDAIAGITGIGAYFLSRGDHASLSPIANRLIALTEQSAVVPSWRTPPEFSGDWMRSTCPDGHLNCGLAHGIPGPLALLSLAQLHGFEATGLNEAIDRIAIWLSDHCIQDTWGVNWPSVVPLARYKGDLVEDNCGELAGTHAGWCYGSPGVARALWLAGNARASEAYKSLALDAMRAVKLRPQHARQLTSPALCHGVAGLLCITRRFEQETGDESFGNFGRTMLADLEKMYEPETLLGFRTSGPDGCRIDQAGLLDGAPGVALALLAASTHHPPTWDRLFLLS